jgi:hypothetical protein
MAETHLAHKAEHAIDLETGAIVGVTVQDVDEGDTSTMQQTLPEAAEQLEAVAAVTDDVVTVIEEVVADKGYHSRTSVLDLERLHVRTYISVNRTAAASHGQTRRPNATRSMRIGGASAVRGANACCAGAGNCWNDPARICTKPVGCGAPMCAATRTC